MQQSHYMRRRTSDSTAPGGDNTHYQRRLAKSLMSSMEADEAINVCQENGWEGVLHVILALQRSADRAQ